jgi:hypothetical protein
MVVVLTTATISMKAAAFFVEALLAPARCTPGSLGPAIASGWRARALAADREPVKDVECSDHSYAQDWYQETEQGACREPGQGQLKSPADGRRARGAEAVAEQPATARVPPHTALEVRAAASNARP